jgi:tetratricopeptide (TPR) repeat protein
MKQLLILLTFILFINKFDAQPPLYNDLLIMYVDGDYKKLAAKAEKYTLKDETKNDPYAYLWTAKALFKISFQNEKDEAFQNAYKESIGFLTKCIKKDKTHEVFDKEKDFFYEVKNSLIELAINEYTTKDYKKAQDWSKKIMQIFPDDVPAKFMEAACKYQLKDIPGATTIWNENQRSFELIQSIDSWTEKEKEFLKLSIIETMICFKNTKQPERAKAIGQKASLWFSKDDDFNKIYGTVK